MTRILETWNEGPGGILASADLVSGGIIDQEILSKKWFVIFNNDELTNLDGFETRDDAIRACAEAIGGLND